tara:strand:+ start:3397 stop:4248 length:852 start_codon:yes stop_codon:yes gene_type:complete
MNIITGEKFQDICDIGISKLEHKPFESKSNLRSIDVDDFNFTNYNNPGLVYVNSSLINKTKKALLDSNLFRKLEQFQNPFNLILHNSDQNFNDIHCHYLDLPNLQKIYTQNINTVNDNVIPIPIGIANSNWPWGNLDIINKVIKEDIGKNNLCYFYFKINGGVREEYRPECYKILKNKGFKFLSHQEYGDYLRTLKSHKFCISPPGNGIDCHRMWEALYMKTIPICEKNILTEYYAKLFPIILVDQWDELDIDHLLSLSSEIEDWSNYDLLDFDNYTKYINLV